MTQVIRAADARRRIDQEQKLQQILGRGVGRLHDEHVRTTNVLIDPDEDLAVREA